LAHEACKDSEAFRGFKVLVDFRAFRDVQVFRVLKVHAVQVHRAFVDHRDL